MNKRQIKYKLRLFRNHWKNHGFIKAWKYTFGKYYIMPTDRDVTNDEMMANAIAREHRLNPGLWKVAVRDNQVLLEPQWEDDDDEWGRNNRVHSLAYYVAMYGVAHVGGVGYEPAEDDTGT